jgi:cytochrome c oxidase subunit 1
MNVSPTDARFSDTANHTRGNWLSRWVFSRDHKVIARQFLFSTLIWFGVGGLMALALRWQLAWPWSNIPIVGAWMFAEEGGQISPEFYTVLVTMHGTIMIFFVVIPILAGAFGNFLIPLMIGARDMAFPTLNMLSYWLMWPAFGAIVASFLSPGGGPAAGWTAYPPLSAVAEAAPGSGWAQTWWIIALVLISASSLLGSINYITTIALMRAPGLSWFRLPMTIWGLLVTAVLQAFALPVLSAALLMLLADRLLGTSFFLPANLIVNESAVAASGGQSLLWQHLFWFYSHPAVYIMILPAMGIVSDVISCFARKPLFGYRAMVASVLAIAVMSFIVWGHHMFVSGMNPYVGMAFMVSTMLIALPSGVKVFNWLATLHGGRIRLTAPMLFAIGFIAMFITGGLSGILMAATPVDIYIHDTYYIVAHFHYVLFAGSLLAVFAGLYYWWPKMFGRSLPEGLGKWHFALTFLFLNGTFFPMHLLGARGFPRRYADPYLAESFADLLPLNQFITCCALGLGAAQLLLVVAMLWSWWFGRPAPENPWQANTLEWVAASPPPHGNFATRPRVFRGPYEYSHPARGDDYWPQWIADE